VQVVRAPFDIRVGETVAGFRVEKVIGRGGSANVYRAAPVGGGESVALKIMHEHDPSGVGRKRFAREAALLKKLQHRHIVKMFDYGYIDAGLPYIVFELLHGRALKSAILRAGEFTNERVGRISLQLLDALEVAHNMGIIHRDIKPQNVFLRAGEEHDHALLLDLGLAKAMEGDGVETKTITGTGYRLGTPRYMSPEMARGDMAGAPGDLYAMALIMAEMIAGHPVVQAVAQIDVLLAHAGDEALPLPPQVRDSPFFGVIQRALAKDLKVRHRTALQMRADVQAAHDLQTRAVAMAERLDAVGGDMAPTLALEGGPTDDMIAEAIRLASDATPRMPIEVGGTVDLELGAFNNNHANAPPMDRLSADVPQRDQAYTPLQPARPATLARPSMAPTPADDGRKLAMVVFAFLVLVVACAAAGYLLAG
jgi:hypothetical protein